MENEKFKEIETLMELDARHDAILNSLEELDKQIETAIRAAQETASNDDALDSDARDAGAAACHLITEKGAAQRSEE